MVNACARAGFVPRIAVEGNDLFVVESMVGAGIGVSVVPEGMTDHQHPGVARIRISNPAPAGRTVLLAYPHAAAHHDSIEHLTRIARDQGRARQESLQKLQ
jgi:DNA-binding transcriptional LysR family regulator